MADGLPNDVWELICLYLPPKSIVKVMCTTRRLNEMLSTPQYIRSHLAHHSRRRKLIFIGPNEACYLVDGDDDGDAIVSRKVELRQEFVSILGSCDGLVLMLTDNEMYVFNPLTLKQVKIPESPVDLMSSISCVFGFGYDSVREDYKIVLISKSSGWPSYSCSPTFVHVYSLKMRVWTRVGDSPFDHTGTHTGVCVEGVIHWPVYPKGDRPMIVYFDFAEEVLKKMYIPRAELKKHFLSELAIIKACLCLVYEAIGEMEIWMKKDYRKDDSWIKLSHLKTMNMVNEEDESDDEDHMDDGDHMEVDFDDLNIIKPLYMGDEETMVLLTEENGLIEYNMNTKEFTEMVVIVDGVVADQVLDGNTFIESLVSPL